MIYKNYSLKLTIMYKINPCVADIELDQQNVCNLCNKKVLNLKEYTDEEVYSLIKNTPEGICGSGTINKMNTAYYLHPFRRFALALLVVFGSSVFILDAKAQDTIQKINESVLIKKEDTLALQTSIKGLILDKETNEPIPFANIWIEIDGLKIGTTSDLDGHFTLIPIKINSKINTPITLNISYVIYKTLKIEGIQLKIGEIYNLGKVYLEEHSTLEMLGMAIPYYHQDILDPDNHRKTTITSGDIERMPRND